MCLLSAVWFTVAFLIYTDDRAAGVGSNGQPQQMALKNQGFGADLDADAIEVFESNNVGAAEVPAKAEVVLQERHNGVDEVVIKESERVAAAGHENGKF